MGTVHQLPHSADAHARLLEKLVQDTIAQHPDSEVARRWAEMAGETIAKYPGPPLPTQPLLDLDGVQGLNPEQMNAIRSLTVSWLDAYFDDVRAQLMNVHRDLLTLQKTVAELEGKTIPE